MFNHEPITLLEIATLASEFNDNVLQILNTDADLKTRFDNAATEQEAAAISASLKGIKFALDDDGEAFPLPADNATEEELASLEEEAASVFEKTEGNLEEEMLAMEELALTMTSKPLDSANAYASIIERLNLRDQFQSAVPASMAAKKQTFISILDVAAEEPEISPFSPQPGLRAFLGNLSL